MNIAKLPAVPGYRMTSVMTVTNDSIDVPIKRFFEEVSELAAVAAQDAVDVADLLDEVVDVIYTARRVAIEAGVNPNLIDKWAADKGALRASMGKNKRRERLFTLGLLIDDAMESVVGVVRQKGES